MRLPLHHPRRLLGGLVDGWLLLVLTDTYFLLGLLAGVAYLALMQSRRSLGALVFGTRIVADGAAPRQRAARAMPWVCLMLVNSVPVVGSMLVVPLGVLWGGAEAALYLRWRWRNGLVDLLGRSQVVRAGTPLPSPGVG